MIEHHRAGPDGGDRIGDAEMGDVGRRAMHRFEHRGRGAVRIDVGGGRKAEPALDGGAEVGEDVAEEIGGDDHVEAFRRHDHARGHGVDVVARDLDIGILRGELPG